MQWSRFRGVRGGRCCEADIRVVAALSPASRAARGCPIHSMTLYSHGVAKNRHLFLDTVVAPQMDSLQASGFSVLGHSAFGLIDSPVAGLLSSSFSHSSTVGIPSSSQPLVERVFRPTCPNLRRHLRPLLPALSPVHRHSERSVSSLFTRTWRGIRHLSQRMASRRRSWGQLPTSLHQ